MTLKREALTRRFCGQVDLPDRLGRRPALPPVRRQDGTFAIMTIPLVIVMLAFCGMALDIGLIYNRKVELHGMAKAVALSAARELNGTASGVTAALAKAKETAERFRYKYSVPFSWSDAAISFSDSPATSAGWVDAATAGATPSGLYYVKVDTAGLDSAAGTVTPVFMPILSNSFQTVSLNDRAVAGRTAINVIPLAVCAMSPDATVTRTNPGSPVTTELVEHGFRRGVSYDLMQLNPLGTAALNYAIDPTLAPGAAGASTGTSASVLGPFVCTGTMWMPHVTGGPIRVTSPFPLDSLYVQLNSRFDDYTGNKCSQNGAPTDFNVKPYAYNVAGGAGWMTPGKGKVAAATTTTRGKLETIADPPVPPVPPPPAVFDAGDYGPLWTYTKAAKSSSPPEPAGGYPTFATTDWGSLYPSAILHQPGPTTTTYPTSTSAPTPYRAFSGTNYKSPAVADLALASRQRRVLNVPLLSCPGPTAPGVSATVLAIGKFFMTVPATATSLPAEFAGLVPESSLTGQVELYP